MEKMIKFGLRLLFYISPKLAVKIQYYKILGYRLNLDKPVDLNEKINYLKFKMNLNEWTLLADKYSVREYVKKKGLEDILVPLYNVYDNPHELIADWNSLPIEFVVKMNNGCGTVKIIKDKNGINLKKLESELLSWFAHRYGNLSYELHYLNIKPKLLVESFLNENNKQCPTDYKIWCFNGKPYCVLVITGRDLVNHKIYRSMYDMDWKPIPEALPHNETFSGESIPKPENWERMIEIASILSQNHKEVRVDLYNIDGKIYFGEMTFTSRGGYNNYNRELLIDMGKQFDVE